VCTAHSREALCALHSVERHCVCTAHSREALCALHSLERHCACTAHSREALCALHSVERQSRLCSTHTHHGQMCCHNTDYVHINGHDRIITVILAKLYIKLPDDGSLVIRNMLEQF